MGRKVDVRKWARRFLLGNGEGDGRRGGETEKENGMEEALRYEMVVK